MDEEQLRRVNFIMQLARERLKLNPKDGDALFALAAAQATLNDAKGGAQTLERLAEIEPNYPGLWTLKTKLHAQLGEAEKARQSRLRGQQSEPASANAASRRFQCPICEALVPADATTCATCGVKFEPSESMVSELDDLSLVAIQEMVQEEVGGATKDERPTPKGPGKPVPRSAPRKGLTNGVALGSRAGSKTGKTNGLRGRTNELRGRTNGLTNGLRGRTNGLTNGVGRTNGLTNGLGHTNGITNGLGRTNGLTNGLGSGYQSVAFRTSRRGNGAQAPGGKLYLIPLVSVSLLLLPLFFIPQYFGPTYPIQIDGQFGDWASVSKTNAAVPLAIQNQDVNITRVAVKDNLEFLSFYIEVRGMALGGGPAPARVTNTFYAFIDVDRSRSTGYQVQGIGAERMIQIRTWGNSVVGASLLRFNASRSSTDWNGWMATGPVYAAGSGSRIEFEASWSDISQTRTGVEVAFASRSWDGQSDAGDVVVTNQDPFVMVSQDTRAPPVISGSGLNLSRIQIEAVDGPVSLSALNVTFQGDFQPTSVAAVDLVDEMGNVLSERPAARTVRFDFGPLALARSETRVLATRAKVGSADGTTIGAFVQSAQDVIVTGGGVSLISPVSAPVSLSYIGTIPAGPRVDGAFGEWKNVTADPIGDVQPVWDRDIDLRAYGFQGYGNNTYFAAAVAGTSLNGTMVPQLNPTVIPAGNGSSNGTVSPPPPPLEGTDQVRFFLDADGNGGTGFQIGGVGAEFLVEIRGQNGLITSADAMRFAGATQADWSWTSIGIAPAAKDQGELEAALQGVRISNASRAFFQVSGWNGARDDSSPASPISVLSVNNPWRSPSQPSPPLLGFNSVYTQDIPGNQQWFFTSGATSGTGCTTNLAASTTAGSAAASTTLSGTSAPICWFTPTSPPNTVAGAWEVILDINKTTNGTKVLRPNAQGDSNGWSAAGCAQASAYLCVDDNPNDGDATYIVSNASTPNDSLFNIFDWTGASGTPPTPLSVINVIVTASCRRTASPPVDVRILVKSGGTVGVGPNAPGSCANSATYTVWSDTYTTDPATGASWTLAAINALQIGVRDNDGTTREVRVSHVVATVTFVPVYTVEIDHCTNSACSTMTTLYGPSNFDSYGNDVTITTPSIPAQTFAATDRIRFLVQLNGTGTSQNQGSVTINYNGAYPGTADSRGTVAVPEFGEVALPIGFALLAVPVARRWHLCRARKKVPPGEALGEALGHKDVPQQ